MTELDAELIPLAFEVIEEFGKLVGFTVETTGEYNVETGTADVTRVGKFFKIAPPEDLGGQFFNGNSPVLVGDKKLTCAAQSFGDTGPKPADEFTIDGIVYEVISVKAIFSGELACLYICQVRAQ